jgi:hypothetical protein
MRSASHEQQGEFVISVALDAVLLDQHIRRQLSVMATVAVLGLLMTHLAALVLYFGTFSVLTYPEHRVRNGSSMAVVARQRSSLVTCPTDREILVSLSVPFLPGLLGPVIFRGDLLRIVAGTAPLLGVTHSAVETVAKCIFFVKGCRKSSGVSGGHQVKSGGMTKFAIFWCH